MLTDQFDHDGMRLLWIEEVATKLHVDRESVKKYHQQANRQRLAGQVMNAYDMPAPVRRQRRQIIKGDGKPMYASSWLWREDQIDAWIENRRGPGGVVGLLGKVAKS